MDLAINHAYRASTSAAVVDRLTVALPSSGSYRSDRIPLQVELSSTDLLCCGCAMGAAYFSSPPETPNKNQQCADSEQHDSKC